jgi:dienelactone hydrolase
MKALALRIAAACACCVASTAACSIAVDDIPLDVSVTDAQGRDWTMRGHVCRPAIATNVPLAIINHGSTSDERERASMEPEPCDGPIARWFVERGFAAVFVLRLGHGSSVGPWLESFHCTRAGFRASGLQTARQIDAIVAAAVKLPDVFADGVVVVGHSAGGWGTIAYASAPHPQVVAAINISGGRGGHYRNLANTNCHPEHLIEAAADFGRTATLPMLWVYARNDSYFGPVFAAALQHAFNAAGGAARLVETGDSGNEGHALFYAAPGIWGPLFTDYLAARGVALNEAATAAH